MQQKFSPNLKENFRKIQNINNDRRYFCNKANVLDNISPEHFSNTNKHNLAKLVTYIVNMMKNIILL